MAHIGHKLALGKAGLLGAANHDLELFLGQPAVVDVLRRAGHANRRALGIAIDLGT